MRYESKEALLTDIRDEYDRLACLLDGIPPDRYREPGVWGDAWTLVDLVAHLAAWQRMFLRWHGEGLRGETPAMPAPGYKWNECPRLNRAIRNRHLDRAPGEVRAELESGYREIARLAESLSEEELLDPGHFDWTGKNSVTTYLSANSASHYRFAIKVIRRWKRNSERNLS